MKLFEAIGKGVVRPWLSTGWWDAGIAGVV